MSDLWEQNCRFITEDQQKTLLKCKNRYEIIKISDTPISFTVQCPVDTGTDVLVHSRHNPVKEAELFADTITTKNQIILFGCGLGYPAVSLLNRLPDTGKLILIVLNNEIFYTAFQHIDLELLLNDERLELVIGADSNDLLKSISDLFSSKNYLKAEIAIWKPEVRTLSKEYDNIRNIIDLYVIKKRSYFAYQKLNCENIAENFSAFASYPGINRFKNLLVNKSALIVSAGPSLTNNLHELSTMQSNFFIIATGTVVKLLLKNNILPDLVVVTDAKPTTYSQVSNMPEHIPVVVFPGTCSAVVADNSISKISAFPIHDQLYNELDKILGKGSVESGESVATVACSAAVLLGCNPVVFIGQDLTVGSLGDVYADECGNGSKCNLSNLRTVEGLNGEVKYTLDNFFSFLQWFQDFSVSHPGTTFVNCTADGAKISGMQHLGLSEFIRSHKKNDIETPIFGTGMLKREEISFDKMDACLGILKKYGVNLTDKHKAILD